MYSVSQSLVVDAGDCTVLGSEEGSGTLPGVLRLYLLIADPSLAGVTGND